MYTVEGVMPESVRVTSQKMIIQYAKSKSALN